MRSLSATLQDIGFSTKTCRPAVAAAIEEMNAGKDPVGVVRDAASNDFTDLLSFDVVMPAGTDPSEVVRQVAGETKAAAE